MPDWVPMTRRLKPKGFPRGPDAASAAVVQPSVHFSEMCGVHDRDLPCPKLARFFKPLESCLWPGGFPACRAPDDALEPICLEKWEKLPGETSPTRLGFQLLAFRWGR